VKEAKTDIVVLISHIRISSNNNSIDSRTLIYMPFPIFEVEKIT